MYTEEDVVAERHCRRRYPAKKFAEEMPDP